MIINDQKIINRWNNVVNDIGCEFLTIQNDCELEESAEYYSIEKGISIKWMLKELKYWLSCYYEVGNVRCDDRFLGKEEYKMYLSETGKLKRLIAKLEKMDESFMVIVW